jgi:hypothetical protein
MNLPPFQSIRSKGFVAAGACCAWAAEPAMKPRLMITLATFVHHRFMIQPLSGNFAMMLTGNAPRVDGEEKIDSGVTRHQAIQDL